MNTYEVVASPKLVVRIFHVIAESPERAAELITVGQGEREGEAVTLVQEKEGGDYEVVDVSPLNPDEGAGRSTA